MALRTRQGPYHLRDTLFPLRPQVPGDVKSSPGADRSLRISALVVSPNHTRGKRLTRCLSGRIRS